MKLNIKTPMLGAQASALIYSTQKLFLDFSKGNTQISEADVRFIHGSSQVSDKTCEIYFKWNNRNMFVVQRAVSFETSFVKALNKLKTQINKIGLDKESLA